MRTLKSERYFPVIVAIHLVLWTVDLSLYEGSLALTEGEDPVQRVIGEIFSSWVVTVFGFNLLMTTRLPWVERIFGGLDKMYLIHRRSGFIAGVLLLLHFGTVPRHPDFSIGKPLGFAALACIILGIAAAAAPAMKRKLTYGKWRSVHRLMGPAFVIGVAHGLLVPTLISKLPLVRTYVFGMSLVGVLSWLYRVSQSRSPRRQVEYTISEVVRLDKSVVELRMKPNGPPLDYQAGQFAFFSFAKFESEEAHPFTIASAPRDADLRLAIKASGDFTRQLSEQAAVGDLVKVEGPYGHLTQQHVKSPQQIWIAGGIGITPFLAMAQDGTDLRQTKLWWSVRNESEAHFHEELKSSASESQLSYNLWRSQNDGYLSVEALQELKPTDLTNADVFICGPAALRDGLIQQLRKAGCPADRIHTEEFAFR